MSARLITVEAAVDALIAEVRAAGRGHVDPAGGRDDREPSYTLAGRPCCLVGRVLFQLGVPLHELAQAGSGRFADVDWSMRFESPADELLEVAQSYQDNGAPWGVALDAALFGAHGWSSALTEFAGGDR